MVFDFSQPAELALPRADDNHELVEAERPRASVGKALEKSGMVEEVMEGDGDVVDASNSTDYDRYQMERMGELRYSLGEC